MDIPTFTQSPHRLNSHLAPPDGGMTRQPAGPVPSSALMGSSSRRQEALHIFERTLSLGYEKLKASQGPAAQFKLFEPLSAEKVAGNILGFIERRLHMDAAEGATQEELQQRLDAGLAGFNRGFAEASEKLQALSLLSPEIEQDIAKTHDLVLAGIDSLRQELLPAALKSEPASPVQVNPAELQAQALPANSSYQYARADSFRFELITADGDRVSIAASASHSFASEQGFASADQISGRLTAESSTAGYNASGSMNWSLAGDLNEMEVRAINDLLGQIAKLAESFFKGNLDEAFNQALELGYERDQIAAFSLNLAQVDVQRASSAYKQFNGVPVESVSPDLYEHLLPLGNFIRNLLEALDAAAVFQGPQELLLGLSEKLVVQGESEYIPGNRLGHFVEQVLSDLNKL